MELLLRLDPVVEFRLANTSWLEEGFRIRRDYLSRVQETFGARIESVRFEEFEMATAINGWVGLLQADRPFLFAIRERLSGTILFVGTVSDPTA